MNNKCADTQTRFSLLTILTLALLLLTSAAHSSAVNNALPHEDIIIYTYRDNSTVKEAAIKGLRYLNPKTGQPNYDGKKILLTHGFMSTPHEFDHMVDYLLLGEKKRAPLAELISEGFDIYTFAFRGHGVGIHGIESSRRSYVIDYQKNDYKFENQFRDFAAMLKYIDKTAKREGVKSSKARKISVIGHSMGGMVATAATATHPALRKYIEIIINIQSPNDFITEYDDAEVGNITPKLGDFIYRMIEKSDKEFPLMKPSTSIYSQTELLTQLLFSRPVNAMANMTSVGRKLLDIAKFGVKSGSSAHRELILDMMGYGLNNNYPFVGLDPKVPVVNLYGGADTIAPKNSIIEQAKMIHEQGGRVWVLEVETAGHLDVVFPRHLDAYMPYVLLALKNPYLLGEKGSHIKVEADHHYMPHLDCKSILSY